LHLDTQQLRRRSGDFTGSTITAGDRPSGRLQEAQPHVAWENSSSGIDDLSLLLCTHRRNSNLVLAAGSLAAVCATAAGAGPLLAAP